MSQEKSSSSSSSSEDEEFELNDEFEKDFYNALSSLKNKDPSIYDKNSKFFSEKSTIVPKPKVKRKANDDSEKPFTILEYEKKYSEEDQDGRENDKILQAGASGKSYVEEQKELKDSFKTFLESDNEGSDDELLKKHVKTEEEKSKEEADYIKWLKGQKQELEDKVTENKLKPLRNYWNSTDLAADEAFLRDYILNRRFMDEESSEEEEENDDRQSDNSEELNEIEDFEHKFNNRFENEDGHNELLKRYPRTIENSLRRKKDKRKRKREEVRERKKKEKQKKREEINKQKNIKYREIQERLDQLKEVTGNKNLAFKDEDILGDFNSDEFDKKMSSMFDDEYYAMADVEKPRIDDLEELIGDEYQEYDENNMDCEAGPSNKGNTTRTKQKKGKKKKTFNDFTELKNKPVFDPKIHESYDKFMEEYYQLDCEDFIGDLPTRFKYRSVEPVDYGLSIDEILTADDKELNSWSSLKKITKIRSNHVEKNEAAMYKKKAQNEDLKKKILPSLFKAPEENDVNEENAEDDGSVKSTDVGIVCDSDKKVTKKKRKQWFKPGEQNKKKQKFHDSRLAAYGINPKKFKSF